MGTSDVCPTASGGTAPPTFNKSAITRHCQNLSGTIQLHGQNQFPSIQGDTSTHQMGHQQAPALSSCRCATLMHTFWQFKTFISWHTISDVFHILKQCQNPFHSLQDMQHCLDSQKLWQTEIQINKNAAQNMKKTLCMLTHTFHIEFQMTSPCSTTKNNSVENPKDQF